MINNLITYTGIIGGVLLAITACRRKPLLSVRNVGIFTVLFYNIFGVLVLPYALEADKFVIRDPQIFASSVNKSIVLHLVGLWLFLIAIIILDRTRESAPIKKEFVSKLLFKVEQVVSGGWDKAVIMFLLVALGCVAIYGTFWYTGNVPYFNLDSSSKYFREFTSAYIKIRPFYVLGQQLLAIVGFFVLYFFMRQLEAKDYKNSLIFFVLFVITMFTLVLTMKRGEIFFPIIMYVGGLILLNRIRIIKIIIIALVLVGLALMLAPANPIRLVLVKDEMAKKEKTRIKNITVNRREEKIELLQKEYAVARSEDEKEVIAKEIISLQNKITVTGLKKDIDSTLEEIELLQEKYSDSEKDKKGLILKEINLAKKRLDEMEMECERLTPPKKLRNSMLFRLVNSFGVQIRESTRLLYNFHYKKNPYFHGKTFLAGAVGFIPTAIFPFKKKYQIGRVTLKLFGIDPETSGGPRIGVIGESYINFGGVGAVIIPFFLGGVIWLLDKYYIWLYEDCDGNHKLLHMSLMYMALTHIGTGIYLDGSGAFQTTIIRLAIILFLIFVCGDVKRVRAKAHGV